MEISERTRLPIKVDFLLISLLCIAPNDQLFKELSIKSDLDMDYISKGYTLTKVKDLSSFQQLINNVSVRRFSYSIIESFLNKDQNQRFLAKQYLRKYKYLYFRYLGNKLHTFNSFPQDKTINAMAIKALIILAGR